MKKGQCNWKYNEKVILKEGKNPFLLQQEEENVSEETNDDTNVNAEANKINDNKKDMVLKMK